MLRKEVNRWKFNHELDKISCNVNIKPKLYIPYTHRGTVHYTHRGTVHYTYRGTVHYTYRGTVHYTYRGPSTIDETSETILQNLYWLVSATVNLFLSLPNHLINQDFIHDRRFLLSLGSSYLKDFMSSSQSHPLWVARFI